MDNETYLRKQKYIAMLNQAWISGDYKSTLTTVKLAGFRVFRNEQGKHKLVEDEKNKVTTDFINFFNDICSGKYS